MTLTLFTYPNNKFLARTPRPLCLQQSRNASLTERTFGLALFIRLPRVFMLCSNMPCHWLRATKIWTRNCQGMKRMSDKQEVALLKPVPGSVLLVTSLLSCWGENEMHELFFSFVHKPARRSLTQASTWIQIHVTSIRCTVSADNSSRGGEALCTPTRPYGLISTMNVPELKAWLHADENSVWNSTVFFIIHINHQKYNTWKRDVPLLSCWPTERLSFQLHLITLFVNSLRN